MATAGCYGLLEIGEEGIAFICRAIGKKAYSLHQRIL